MNDVKNQQSIFEIQPTLKDVGGLPVRRVLPYAKKRMVGPFIFLDHMGPFSFPIGQKMAVRPHPHIGLSTLTYLFKGHIHHRDSLGNSQVIQPGEVNWMTAGKGISHSERGVEGEELQPHTLHGLQFWVALPDDQEDVAPSFKNFKKSEIPQQDQLAFTLDVVIGEFEGLKSPVQTFSKTLFLHLKAKGAGQLKVHEPGQELGVYIVEGEAQINSKKYQTHSFTVFEPGASIELQFTIDTRLIVVGGESFPQEKNIWWNFVASSKEKIQQAKLNWNRGVFPMVPGEKDRLLAPDT